MLFFFFTVPLPVAVDDDEEAPAIIMGWSKVMMCSYSYMVSVAGSAAVVEVVVDVEGVGEGAAVVVVLVVADVVADGVGDGEEAAVVVMVGVGVETGGVLVLVVVVVVEGRGGDAGDASSVVSTGGGSVPFFMFPEAEPRATKMTATLCDLIQLRDVAWTERPSCLTHRDHSDGRGRSGQSQRRTAGLRVGSIGYASRSWPWMWMGRAMFGKLYRKRQAVEGEQDTEPALTDRWGRCRPRCKSQSLTSPAKRATWDLVVDLHHQAGPALVSACGTLTEGELHESLHPETGVSLFSLLITTLLPCSP
jgi:hypothetical protein